MAMTKADRSELRALIRQRFRVLRADVDQRHAELVAELEIRLNERCADDDKAWADLAFTIEEAAREANRKANDAVRNHVGRDRWPDERKLVGEGSIAAIRALVASDKDHSALRRQGRAQIDATVKAAHLQLDRDEVDLLSRLTVGALESDEAREFLAAIPTVSQLVPADRLLALEQALRDTP